MCKGTRPAMDNESTIYLNRELSWLEYHQRLLDEANDADLPLLERLKCITQISAQLDELFLVRVGGLKLLADSGSRRLDLSGMTPKQQLGVISRRTRKMSTDLYQCFAKVEKGMAEVGIKRVLSHDLTDRQMHIVEQVFEVEIASILTPLAVASPAQLPPIPNQALCVCTKLQSDNGTRYVIIPFGATSLRILTLYAEGGYTYLLLEDAVCLFADRLFPDEIVAECIPFRITSHADARVRRDLAGDLSPGPNTSVAPAPPNDCVRLEIDERASAELLDFLLASLNVTIDCTYRTTGPINLAALEPLTQLHGFDKLRYEHWPPQASPDVDLTTSIFDTLSQRDILLYHPYESYQPVLRLLEEATDDPDVVAIKQTLYGADGDSLIVEALRRAAENDKYVTAIIELKPRQGTAYKMEWAKSLEQSAVQVIYGVQGLRTHAKVCIIVRREPTGIQRYVHFGTGDYSEAAARYSSDVSILTSDAELGADATEFFNAVASHSYTRRFRKIDTAPATLRDKLIEMINAEIQWKRQGGKAFITAKLNALGDQQIIDALYAASQEGVRIRLNICGLCCLRPQVPGLSDNIRVISIVDRFREHARIFHFHHGGSDRVFISSADWMPRNLDRRVELLVPVEAQSCRHRLLTILETYFRDNVKACVMQPDGTYRRRKQTPGKPRVRCKEILYQDAVNAVRESEQTHRTAFQPHRAPGSDV